MISRDGCVHIKTGLAGDVGLVVVNRRCAVFRPLRCITVNDLVDRVEALIDVAATQQVFLCGDTGFWRLERSKTAACTGVAGLRFGKRAVFNRAGVGLQCSSNAAFAGRASGGRRCTEAAGGLARHGKDISLIVLNVLHTFCNLNTRTGHFGCRAAAILRHRNFALLGACGLRFKFTRQLVFGVHSAEQAIFAPSLKLTGVLRYRR